MAKPALVALGAVLLAGGVAVTGYGLTRKATGGLTPEASAAMASAIGELDAEVRAARALVEGRATTLSKLQAVQAAVATDQATAMDMMVKGELNFTADKGEVIELGRVPNGGAPEPLLIQPEGSMPNPHAGKPGSYEMMTGEKAIIIEVAEVIPKAKADMLKGYVAVSRPLELKSALERLAAAGVNGVLHIGDQTRTIGSPVGGGSAAGLGLILLVIGLVTKGKDGGGAHLRASASGIASTNIGTAATQVSSSQPGVVAAGTPSPYSTGGGGGTATNLGTGAMVGRWEIIKRLGSGGMADVYLARSKGEAGFEKTVAVKVMHPHLARNQRAVDLFLDEARLAAQIHHPNVVAIHDLGKIGDDYVIAMEYVDGVDLEKLLTAAREGRRPVPINVALGIMCRVCDGLTAAHRAVAKDGSQLNIIHRDVKSANVLVSRQGGVKVVDFGIAKAAQQGHQTQVGETKGTPSMMAPEQRVGEAVDVRADVYSTAAVAFEVLTGTGVNLDLAALAHLGVEGWPHLPLPTSLRPQLPAELDTLLLGAMAFEREQRPADCAALEEQLEAIMKKYGLTASDKDIARWAASELSQIQPAGTEPTAMSTPSV